VSGAKTCSEAIYDNRSVQESAGKEGLKKISAPSQVVDLRVQGNQKPAPASFGHSAPNEAMSMWEGDIFLKGWTVPWDRLGGQQRSKIDRTYSERKPNTLRGNILPPVSQIRPKHGEGKEGASCIRGEGPTT